jgi:phosphodiesterase/alkaline phosphatase D-like protein
MSKITITARVLDKDSPIDGQSTLINYNGNIKIQVSTNPEFFGQKITTEPLQVNEFGFVKTTIDGLVPNTKYYARIVSENEANTDSDWVSEFTIPATGAHSFSFGIGACNQNFVQAKVWNRVGELADEGRISFFYLIGDWFYSGVGGITINNEAQFYRQYDRSMFTDGGVTATQRPLFEKLPVYYQWDDHDFGGDNRDQFNPVKPAGLTAYRKFFPGPTLANLGPTAGAYYSWTRGRIRFVATDVRSERTVDNTTGRPNDSSRYIFHPDQEQWFKDQISAAAGASQAVIWVCTNPWIGPGAATGGDSRDPRGNNIANDWRTGRPWNGYVGISAAAWFDEGEVSFVGMAGVTYDLIGAITGTDSPSSIDHWGTRQLQRNRIAQHIETAGMSDRVIIISGDMHGFAFDDGYLHTITGGYQFSGGNRVRNPNNGAGLKVCQVAPMFRPDGEAISFFQDPVTISETNKYYALSTGAPYGSTGFAAFGAKSSVYDYGTEDDIRGGPYYIGPVSVSDTIVAIPKEHWGLPGTTCDILCTVYWDSDGPVPLVQDIQTSSYSIMDVTDLGGSTMGFRYRAVLTYPWTQADGITLGPFENGCPGTTCPEKTIIDQSWIVDIT